MSKLIDHAECELQLAGLFDKNSAYDGEIGVAVMELVKVFSAQGHSGYSAYLTLGIFYSVAKFEHLTPVTVTDFECSGGTLSDGNEMWQCKRNSALFLNKDHTGYYNVTDKNRKITYFEADE